MAEGFAHYVLTTVSGVEIPAYTKNEEGVGSVYLSAGIHGDEPSGPYAMLEMLKEGYFDERLSWLLCPLLNPTGMSLGTRENAEGVDLNRDYLKRKTAEVHGHVTWLESQLVPDIFISLHEDWESEGFYLYEIQTHICRSDAKTILGDAKMVIPVEPSLIIDDHEVREPGWIFHKPEPDSREQWPEAIFMAERGTKVSYTLETPSSLELEQRVKCHKVAVECAVRQLLLT